MVILSLLAIGFIVYNISNEELQEDELKLPLELVPLSMHGFNVRSRLNAEQWQRICNIAHGRYENKVQVCEICGESGKQQGFSHSLECHEQWEYNTITRTQKLVRLRSICPMCHKVFHYGLSVKKGYGERALQHFIKVNNLTLEQAEEYIMKAKAEIKLKSKVEWQLDLTYLNQNQFKFLKTTFNDREKYNCQFYEF